MNRMQTEGDPALRPRNPQTGDALPEREQPGYYAGYSTMGQQKFWDAATRDLVNKRLEAPVDWQFFTVDQVRFWTAVFDHILPQTDRTPDRRISILGPVDKRLHSGRTVGYRFEGMPHDHEVYKDIGIEAINAEARTRYGGEFLSLPHLQQDQVLRAIHDGDLEGSGDVWERLPVHRFWQLITTDAIDAYYAHPWVWDEIGFGGPAYPRAYMRLERGEPEPWEVDERRYEWIGPSASVSDQMDDASHHHTEATQHRHQPGERNP